MATIESVIALHDSVTATLKSASAAAVQTARDLNNLEKVAIDEFVTPSAVASVNNVSAAAANAANSMKQLHETTSSPLLGTEDVNRLELMTRQAELMESKWIGQQQEVARLKDSFNEAVTLYGAGTEAVARLDAELFSAQMQENHFALQAVKALEAIDRQEQRAAKVPAAIAKQEDNATRVTDEIQRQIQATSRAVDEANRLADAEIDIESGAAKAADEQYRFTENAKQSHMRLLNIHAAVELIKTGVQVLSGLLSDMDAYTDVNARLSMVNDGLQTQQQLQASVFAAARNTRVAYEDIADSVNRIAWNAPDLFADTSSIVNYTELAAKAMKLGGRSPAENAASMDNMTRGLESGGLNGENFTSLFRSASGQSFLRYVADGLDVSMGQLQALAGEGELTAVAVAEALSASAAKINEDFGALPATFGENIARAKDSAMLWLDSLNQAGAPLDLINQKITDFVLWLESAGGQQFFADMTQGMVVAGSIIIPIVDNVFYQLYRLTQLSNDPGNQAFFQSLGGYARFAGDIISSVIETAVNLVGFVVTNWPVIEPIVLGIVGALVLWHGATIAMNIVQGISNALELVSAGIKAAKTGATLADTSATAAATAAQWGLNASLLACPLTWIVLAVIAVIAVIVILVRKFIDLWNTNDDFALALLRAWNAILNFFDTIPLFFARVWDGICIAFDDAKLTILSIMETIVNGVITGINFLIDKLNAIPGVSIEAVGTVSWAAESDIKAKAAQQARAEDIAAMEAEIEAKAAQREQSALNYIEERKANRAAKEAEEQALKENPAAYEGYTPPEPYTPPDYATPGGINVNPDYGSDFNVDKVGSVGSIRDSVNISSEDLKYMRDIAEREAINNITHTSYVPQMQVTFGDVRESADIDAVTRRVVAMAEEELAVYSEGVHK